MPGKKTNSLKSNLIIAGIVITLCCLIAFFLFEQFRMIEPSSAPDPLIADLTNTISRYENGEIPYGKLADITPFAWDRIYCFGPYTNISKLDSMFGFSWRKVCFTTIETLENYTLFIFTEKGKVIHCFEYSREYYDFSTLENLVGYPVENSVFIVDEKGYPVLINPEFILGNWYGTEDVTDIHGSYTKEYNVEFIDEDELVFQMKSPYDGFKAKFDYRFIDETTILVENERAIGGKWNIKPQEEYLVICIWENPECVTFSRNE